MADKHLETFQLGKMLEKRHKHAVSAITFVVEKRLPEGIPPGDSIVEQSIEFALAGAAARGGADLVDKLETALSYVSLSFLGHLTGRLWNLSFKSGDTVMVEETRRFDLVSVLARVNYLCNNDRIRLVSPNILFAQACYSYRWRGTIFEFALGPRVGKVRATYIGWHPSPTFEPKSNEFISVHAIRHRLNSDDRGMS